MKVYKHIKLYEEFSEDLKIKTNNGNIPPIDFFDNNGNGGDNNGDDGDDNDYTNYPYYKDLIEVFIEGEYGYYLHEVWSDEASIKKLTTIKDTDFYKFCENLMNEYKFNHNFFKNDINNILVKEINKYNDWATKLRTDKARDEAFEEITNTKEITFDDMNVIYKIKKPETSLVNKLIRTGETKENASKPLLYILNCNIDGFPEPTDDDKWSDWVKNIYNPRFKKYIEPWAVENGYRLWSY